MEVQTEREWPGQRLGLPATGVGAIAGWGRRIVALVVDWVLSTLVASVLTGRSVATPADGADRWLPLLVYGLEAAVLTATVGGSAGQLVLGVVVRRVHGGARLDILRALARSFLICLVIPPVIFNRDQRGLHDLAVDSVTVRR